MSMSEESRSERKTGYGWMTFVIRKVNFEISCKRLYLGRRSSRCSRSNRRQTKSVAVQCCHGRVVVSKALGDISGMSDSWHSRGRRFDPDRLHHSTRDEPARSWRATKVSVILWLESNGAPSLSRDSCSSKFDSHKVLAHGEPQRHQ